jgi:hypothetical protein
VLSALHQLSALDTEGLVAGPLDYTKQGQPPTRSVYISQPDPALPGGLKPIDGAVEADPAKTYQPGT